MFSGLAVTFYTQENSPGKLVAFVESHLVAKLGAESPSPQSSTVRDVLIKTRCCLNFLKKLFLKTKTIKYSHVMMDCILHGDPIKSW